MFDSFDSLCEELGARELFHLLAVAVVGDRVGEDNLLEGRIGDAIGCRTAHDAVAGYGANRKCSGAFHLVGCHRDGTCRIDHIVDEYDILTRYVTNNLDRVNDIGLLANFVAEHEWHSEFVGELSSTFRSTHIGGCDDEVVESLTADIWKKDEGCLEVVDRYVEESLNLVGMEVHDDEAVDTHT